MLALGRLALFAAMVVQAGFAMVGMDIEMAVNPRPQNTAEKMDVLRALAAEDRWPQIRELLEGPAYRSLYDQAALLFEEIGDQRAAKREWGAAVRCFHFGLWHAMQKPGSKGPVTGAAAMTA